MASSGGSSDSSGDRDQVVGIYHSYHLLHIYLSCDISLSIHLSTLINYHHLLCNNIVTFPLIITILLVTAHVIVCRCCIEQV